MTDTLPRGTVTFLFTDIEGSTTLWERHPEAMKAALARHDRLIREAVETSNGFVVKTTGDGCHAVFRSATDAVTAAVMAQRGLAELAANTAPAISVRMGLHTGEAELRDGDYYGPAVNRAVRVMSIGFGGQTLISGVTAALLKDRLPAGVSLLDLGQHRLLGLAQPEHVYQLIADGLRERFPPLRSTSTRPVRLPQPPTRFVGRSREIAEIVSLLSAPGTRLLTLVGPGGIGKTRLAIEAARAVAELELDRFKDGVYFVPLAPLRSAGAMPALIAGALDFQFGQAEREPRRQLIDYLRRREVLLVFDNMEQLLEEGGAGLAADILDAAPGTSILATSRTRLGIRGEQLFSVPGMSLPEPDAVRTWDDPQAEAEQYGGLRLFAQAARRIQPDFKLTQGNIAAVARIGQQVQGMPLGLELAACWLDLLSPAEITAEIDRSLDVLATDFRDVPERQRSMRAVFETTWQFLSERERALLLPLSAFRAPFSREAAEAVAGASLRDLMALAGKSWLQRVEADSGSSRYQMHELLRQFAEERLEADSALTDAINRRFIHFYAGLLESSFPRLIGPEQLAARDNLTTDLENVTVAWNLAVDLGDFATAADKMLLPLFIYGRLRPGLTIIDQLLEQAIAARDAVTGAPEDDPTQSMLRTARIWRNLGTNRSELAVDIRPAWVYATRHDGAAEALGYWYIRLCALAGLVDDLAGGVRRLREWVSACQPDDQSWTAVEARRVLGAVLLFTSTSQAELAEAEEQFQRAAEGFRHAGNRVGLAEVLTELAAISARRRAYAEALDRLAEAESLLSASGTSALGWLLDAKIDMFQKQGRIDEMFAALAEQARVARDQGDFALEGHAYSFESVYALRYSTPEHARRARLAVIELERLQGNDGSDWNDFELGEIARVTGDLATARSLYAASANRFEQHDNREGMAYCERAYGDLALASGDFAAAYHHYRQSLERLPKGMHWWPEARALAGLARAAAALGHFDESARGIAAALRITDSNNELDLATVALLALAELAAARQWPAEALMLTGLMSGARLTWNETRDQSARVEARARERVGDAAAEAARRQGSRIDLAALIAGLAALPDLDADNWLDEAARVIGSLASSEAASSNGQSTHAD